MKAELRSRACQARQTPETASFGPSVAVMTAAHTSASRTFEGQDPVIGQFSSLTVHLVLRALLPTQQLYVM